MTGLDTSLTPLRFLRRAADVHPAKVGLVDGPRRITWEDAADRAVTLARAIRAAGVRPGERVAFCASNSAELVLAHFAAPLAQAVLVATNTRLSTEEIRYILDHSEARVLFVEAEIAGPHAAMLAEHPVEVVVLPEQDGSEADPAVVAGARSYADFCSHAGTDTTPLSWTVEDDTTTLTINYTSGTTGNPKGVMYTHRGAYLNSLGQVIHQGYDSDTVYLWTLPLFHCNGWCSAWAVTAVAGTHVSLRAVRGPELWHLLEEEQVTHLAGAPTVLSIMASADEAAPLERPVTMVTAGAPPNPATLAAFHHLNIRVVHAYGLTETYGPYALCEWQPEWRELNATDLAEKLSRQGVGMLTSLDMRVVETDPDGDRPAGAELVDVPADGTTMGEIVMSGNTVMKGYYKDDAATEESFAGGWFHSGDLGVRHPDGYVQLMDRAKDVVISGGENISSIEVEQALMKHPSVSDAAVIGVPDERWGERPKAFVVLAAGKQADEAELIAHVKGQIASFKAPKAVLIMDELPKTSTGKVRKNELKDVEKQTEAAR